MKQIYNILSIAALVLAGAMTTGCNSLKEELEVSTPESAREKTVTVTSTVGLDTSTKALTAAGVKTFSTDETIAVFYTNKSSDLVKTTYTFTAGDLIDGGRRATITVSMTEPKAGGAVKYIYPANMANDDGTVNYSALSTQDGTLETLAANFDLATYDGTLIGEAALPASVTLSNQLAILELNITDGSSDITGSIRQLIVKNGANTVTINRTPADGPVYVAMQPVTSGAIVFEAAKGKNLYTKTVSGKTLGAGEIYPVNLSMSIVEGALSGLFSVSASKKVYFSKGNLRAYFATAGTSHTWDFADKQFNAIGNDAANNAINGDGSVSTGGKWVDLFGWSTASTTYGINNSTTASDYSGDFRDWGTNAITNGGNMASIWRTLGNDEWKYLFVTRASGSTVNGTSDARYTHAAIIVNVGTSGAKGIILFPDGVTIDGSEADSWGTINGNSNWDTKCSIGQWEALEAKGCVFLPAAGYRTGTDASSTFGYFGKYWSSTPTNDDYAYSISFESNQLGVYNHTDYRHFGISVRLVRDAN